MLRTGTNILLLLLVLAALQACDRLFLGDGGGLVGVEENMGPPPKLNDGIEVSTLQEADIDGGIMKVLSTFQENRNVNQRSFLVARNNKLVLEAYFNGWNRERLQDMRSASKSVTSALVGIAIDRGDISGVDQKIYSFFDEYDSFDNWDPLKEEMTIQDFLQMRTGLDCNDRQGTAPASREHMYDYKDWVKLVLDAKVIGNPGEQFVYCSGSPVVLGALVSNAAGMTIPRYAGDFLFDPLGIENYAWEYMPSGRVDTGGHLHLRPRDMLKFGLLFLNNGTWKDRQIISKQWVEESSTSYGQAEEFEYGYLWWANTFVVDGREIPTYFARGNGGQLIFVIPSLDTVVVFTAGKYNENWIDPIMRIMETRVLPYIQ